GEAGTRPGRDGRRRVAHLRHLPPPPPGGLADHAVRVRRVLAQARRVLRPQPVTGRAATEQARRRSLPRNGMTVEVWYPLGIAGAGASFAAGGLAAFRARMNVGLLTATAAGAL